MPAIMKMVPVPTFHAPDGAEVQFRPTDGYSMGRTHGVWIDGARVGYITTGTKPDAATASWWMARHRLASAA